MSDKYRELRELISDPKPSAWLVTNGTIFKDRAYISAQGALKSAIERADCANVRSLFQIDTAQLAELLRERDALLEALENIANPLACLQKEAAANGDKLNGAIAVELSHDSFYLKKLATDAIESAKRQEGL